ncbi:MAG TPA: hypothetical protein VNE39_22695 [Planctomycetota bacterium]|nr:hypothetical protein [Planctomycetota bacterium]
MGDGMQWSKATYEASVSSRCWWYTPYDDGWDKCPSMAEDAELRGIVEMERALGDVPAWARQIVERSIQFACPCGHYLFPRPYLEALDAIGAETPATFVHGCFTVARERKRAMMDYVLCLDAWLAGAAAEDVARELAALGSRRIAWDAVCAELWRVLGERTELKELLVERLIHSQRCKIKWSPWDDDLASEFGRDLFLGPIGKVRNPAKIHCYIEQAVPGFDEGASPRVRRLEARLAELCPDWKQMQFHTHYGWLCAPKAFRFLERLVWAIGQERPPRPEDRVPGFLQIEDTHPNQDEAREWWKAFVAALDAWWQGQPATGPVADDVARRLGAATPVKRWLVRLFRRKLRFYASYEEGLDRLINPRPNAARGSRSIGAQEPK